MKHFKTKFQVFGSFCLVSALVFSFQTTQAQHERKFQEFDVVQDYKGATHLVLKLLTSFDKNTTQVIVSQSTNGKDWEDVAVLDIQKDYKASFQNVPLSFELDEIEKLLKNINNQVYFKVNLASNGKKNKTCGFATISKAKLLSLQAEASLGRHLTHRNK